MVDTNWSSFLASNGSLVTISMPSPSYLDNILPSYLDNILLPGHSNWFSDKHLDQINSLGILFQYFSGKNWWESDILAFGHKAIKMLIQSFHFYCWHSHSQNFIHIWYSLWNSLPLIFAWLAAADHSVSVQILPPQREPFLYLYKSQAVCLTAQS